jgi:L-ribulose-5-phosphate 4-epimerase
MSSDPYADLRQRAWNCNQELPAHGVVIGTFGNASAVDRERGIFAIKPSGVAYAELQPRDLAIVDLDGEVVDGALRPSSDTPTHALLYRAFSSIGGITHTHSSHATAWAQACRPIPLLGTTHADLAPEEIPCTRVMSAAETAGDYEIATGELIVERFADLDPGTTTMVLVARHGPFTWGATPEKAVEHSILLEELARIAFLTVTLDPEIEPLEAWLREKHFQRKHGPDAYYGQDNG